MERRSNVWFAGRLNFQIRILHWSVVGVVVSVATAYYRHWYTTQTETANWSFLVIHMNIGVMVLILSCVMAIFRLRLLKLAQKQKIEHPNSVKIISARILHSALYGMLIVLPISGYIGIGFALPLFGVVTLPRFVSFESVQQLVDQSLDILMITFIEPFANFHRDIGVEVILPLLLIGHIGAAFYNSKSN